MKKHLVAFTLAFMFVASAFSQTTDWLTLFRQVESTQPTEKAVASQRLSAVIEELSTTEVGRVEPDILRMLLASEQDASVRVGVSGVLGVLAMVRRDSAVALKSAIPALLNNLADGDSRVRQNAVFTIINLKPDMPAATIQPLTTMTRDSNAETVRGAVFGLARVCKTSSIAVGTLKSLLAANQPKPAKLHATKAVGWGQCENSELLAALKDTLKDSDTEMVLATIRSIGDLGARASILKPELEDVARTHRDQVVVAQAALVLSRLP